MLSKQAVGYGKTKSVIRELAGYGAQQAKLIGEENVFNFTIGNPSVPAPSAVKEAYLDIVTNYPPQYYNNYTNAAGLESCRTAIADNLNERFGTDYDFNDLFMVCGAAAGLIGAFSALIASHDSEIIIMAPYFPEYKVFIEGSGGKAVIVEAAPDMRINYEGVAAAINENTVAVIVNSPNNPSGVIYSEEEINKLCDLLREKEKEIGHPVYIVCDEPYRELVLVDDATVPFIPKHYDNTIVVYSWSKSLSLPGSRIGYVLVPKTVAHPDLMPAVAGALRMHGYVCAPALMQRVVERCVAVPSNLDVYKTNRDLLYEKLTALGYTVAYPAGAFYLFLKAPDGDSEKFSEKAKKHNLLLVPGTGFGAPTHLRLAFCVDTDRVERSIPLFAELMKEYS